MGDDHVAAPPKLVAPELVVHLFAPTGGPHADDVYQFLRGVWDGCRGEFGMDAPIATLGVPVVLPPRHRRDLTPNTEPIAAQGRMRSSAGVFQSLLRREHDVLCLSVMLAPQPDDRAGWVQLHRGWERVCAQVPEGLLGVAELYLARLAAPDPTPAVAATPELGAACRLLLPTPSPEPDFDRSGTQTAGGFAVWEADRSDDARARRCIAVVAAHDRDVELSAWTWTRGDMAVTPFAQYLMHAAKLRYHLRVWAGGEPARALRQAADRAAADVAVLVNTDAAGAIPEALGQRLAALRRETLLLASAETHLRELQRSVEISAWNMGVHLSRETPGEACRGLFTDDRSLAEWFTQQLADDHVYLTAALDRARETADAGRALAGDHGGLSPRHQAEAAGPAPRSPGQAPTLPPRTSFLEFFPAQAQAAAPEPDVVLSASERANLLTALARAYRTDDAAERLLARVGLPRERRRNLDHVPRAQGWAELFDEFDNGAVRAPYRRILAAALEDYPYNRVFRTLAHHHGIDVAGHATASPHNQPPEGAPGELSREPPN